MNDNINKPITVVIKETKSNLINILNNSKLPLAVLDLILQGIYYEIHSIAEKQTVNDENAYIELIKNNNIKMGDANESK